MTASSLAETPDASPVSPTVHGEQVATRAPLRWQRYLWLVIPFLAIPAMVAAWNTGIPRSPDTPIHAMRISMIFDLMRSGVFFPRWIPDMLLGYGYPVLSYYSPAFYYAAGAAMLGGLSLYTTLMLSYGVIMIVAGFGMWLLAQDLFDRRPSASLVSAAAYMLAPYLMINFFNRGAFPEASAQAILPWAIWCAGRIFTSAKSERYAAGLMCAVALLACTHNLTLIYAPPMIAIYLVCGWFEARRREPSSANRRALLGIAACAGAMALSAFVWMPLLLERGYVTDRGFEIARGYIGTSIWSLSTFLDTDIVFSDFAARPVPLGIVQTMLAIAGVIAGFVIGKRHDWRWWYWLGIAAFALFFMGGWSAWLWTNTTMGVLQFPWRLLGMATPALALFAGAIPLVLRRTWLEYGVAFAVVALILFAHTPRIGDKAAFSSFAFDSDAVVQATFELGKGVLSDGQSVSSIQEFRPRWTDSTLVLDHSSFESPDAAASAAIQVEIVSASDFDTTLRVTIPNDADVTPVRFATLYFPGWQVTDNGIEVEAYPTTNLGLLTVDLAPGEHAIQVRWAGTGLQHVASAISLFSLFAIGILLLLRPQTRWFALPLLLLGAIGVWGWLWQSQEQPLQTPTAALEENGLRLLGATFDLDDPARAKVMPWWQVIDSPPANLVMRWQVQDADGNPVAEAAMRPFFNTQNTADWAPNTSFDDAYLLPLPAGLAAGDYRLALEIDSLGDAPSPAQMEPLPVYFDFTLDAAVPDDPAPAHQLDIPYGDNYVLAGDSLVSSAESVNPAVAAVVQPGDRLRISLFWKIAETIYNQTRTFVRLSDPAGNVLTERDEGMGPMGLSSEIWLPDRTYQDPYQLSIPMTTTSGIYYPLVGLYDYKSKARILPQIPDAPEGTGEVRLLPVKVLNPPARAEGTRIDANLGDFAQLVAWEAPGLSAGIEPETTYTVTLVWKSLQTTPTGYTRFLQLVNDAGNMAGQKDAPTVDGRNPTWAWVPGELVEDQVTFTTAEALAPGSYRLLVGLYDPETVVRVAASDDKGKPYESDAILLDRFEVQQ